MHDDPTTDSSRTPEHDPTGEPAPNGQVPAPKPRSGLLGYLPLAIIVVGFIGFVLYSKRTAPVPEIFDKSVTIEAAMSQASETGKPIFAIVTADWCPPCQHYKRTALRDREVVQTLRDQTIPLYVDSDHNPEAVQQLSTMGAGPIRALPTTLVVSGGRVVAKAEGAVSAARVLELVSGSGTN